MDALLGLLPFALLLACPLGMLVMMRGMHGGGAHGGHGAGCDGTPAENPETRLRALEREAEVLRRELHASAAAARPSAINGRGGELVRREGPQPEADR